MNHYTHQYENDQMGKEPILKIWRELKAREESDESSPTPEDHETDNSTQTLN